MLRFCTAPMCAIVLLVSAGSARAEASYPDTFRLVRTMRADEMTLASIKASFSDDSQRGRWTKEQVACLSQVKYPLITDALALELAPKLTDAEVAEAIAFYRSETGRKLTEQAYQNLKDGRVDTDVLRALSAQQRREFEKFSQRSAGRKLIQQQPFTQPGVAKKVSLRLSSALGDCEYDDGIIERGRSCSSVPVRSPDHQCSAAKEFTEYGAAGTGVTLTAITMICRNSSQGIAQFNGRLEGVDFKWRDDNTLEVIHPSGTRPEPGRGPQKYKVAYRPRTQSDPPAPKCWPNPLYAAAVHVELEPMVSQPFWMSYVDDERCLLSKRIERSKIPGARTDAVVQFRKLKAAQYPFGTSGLVFFETASGYDGKSAAIRGAGLSIDMVAGKQGFHLAGAAAEKVLRAIGTTGLQLEILPAAGAAFRVELSPTDIEWALPPFQRCIGSGL
jgi:hypothetical protein